MIERTFHIHTHPHPQHTHTFVSGTWTWLALDILFCFRFIPLSFAAHTFLSLFTLRCTTCFICLHTPLYTTLLPSYPTFTKHGSYRDVQIALHRVCVLHDFQHKLIDNTLDIGTRPLCPSRYTSGNVREVSHRT